MKILSNCGVFNNLHPVTSWEHPETGSKFSATNDTEIRELKSYTAFPPGTPLYCTLLMKERTRKYYHHRRINQNFYCLEYVKAGSLYFHRNDQFFLAEKGELFLMKPSGFIEMRTGPEGFCEKSSLVLQGDLLEALLRQTRLMEEDILRLGDGNHFEAYLDRIIQAGENPEGSEMFQLSCSSICFELLLYLARRVDFPPCPPSLQRALRFCAKNLSRPIRTAEIAQAAQLSIPTLNRLYHLHLASTPYRNLTEQRMRHAANLLAEQNLSVKETALQAGYENPLNFSTEFKKYFGCPPKTYQTRLKKGIPGKI